MLGRLRLLRRFPSLETPRHRLFLATGNPAPARILSSLFPPSTTPCGSGGQGSRRPHLSPQPRKRSEGGFCTRSVGTEETANPVPSPYLFVCIRCSKHVAITLSEALLCFGASSASMDEVSDSEEDEICITSIFADGQDVHTSIWLAANSIGLDSLPSYDVSIGEQCDWIANIQETFHPIEVTEGLWIVPEWRTPVDLQATNIILNPGMAFGTGEHPTTKLCLLLLHGLIRGGECFLDYGSGSGVLGIAAIKMGAAFSVGIDTDPQAVASARQNIALNDIDSNRMSVYLVPSKICPHSVDEINKNPEESTFCDVDLDAQREKFDVVIANILLNPLLELAEDIVSFGKPGSIISVSGILSEQLQQIQELYSRYLDNILFSEMDGWACLHGTKKCGISELGSE